MRKIFAAVLTASMVMSLAACGSSSSSPAATTAAAETKAESQAAETEANADAAETTAAAEAPAGGTDVKVGMVCIGNQNMAYDRNFYMAADAATEQLAKEGINVEWIYTYDHAEGDPVAADCEELADSGCIAVFLNSYGMEPAMLTIAEDYPDTVFCALTNETSKSDDLENTVNAFPSIYEARYLAGIAAGMKLNQMIEEGDITEDQAVIGYVGAYTYSEVLSGYTSFYLGARSVCPSATMMVEFIGSWGDPAIEAATAQDLIDRGAQLISQHSDATTPSTTAQENGICSVGYNISMTDVAPESALISSRIDWTNYFVYVIRTLVNGGTVDQDYMQHGIADGDVALTELNEAIAAPGTAEAIEAAAAKIKSGELKVFDTDTFTVGGAKLESSMIDMDADFQPDSQDAVSDGFYHESFYKSAPSFSERIDGITLVNEEY
ncbi:MAG: BMP family ABC transporter substrate-binding protein [Eubacteriales bacterium]|nr:BMP family ABC transporter substrate-binding protein [Eubacteriales bacterium]